MFTMNSKKLVSFLLLAAMLFTLLPSAVFAKEVSAKWDTAKWEKTEEGLDTVYTGKPGETLNVMYMLGKTDGNTVEFDARINNTGKGDLNLGAAYKFSDGTQYFCEYNEIKKGLRIRYITPKNKDGETVAGYNSLELQKDKWYAFKIIYGKNYIRFYVDGELELSVDNTSNIDFKDGSMYLQSYNMNVSFKNIKVSKEEIPDIVVENVKVSDYDFEFSSKDSITGFTAENGKISWKNGKLVCDVNGKNATVTTPYISLERGMEYSVYLPVRNTVLIRLKNATSADKLRINYTTSMNGDFVDSNIKTIDISPNSDFTTYMVNLSDTKGANGFLRKLSIEAVGAESGTVEIDAISFERETPIYGYAGKIESCIAIDDNVIIKGTLNSSYKGKTVDLYETLVSNYDFKLKKSEKIASVKSDGDKFEITVPFVGKNNVNRLSSIFIAAVGDTRISDFFYVENYSDYESNPYEFDLPELTVKATDAPFNAKGDAFTDDTKAIQTAIDHVSSKGGGTVIVPGDTSTFGRRYMVTSVQLKDNVELRVEKGAILWQSPRPEEYRYDVKRGHDITIPNIPWTHTASVNNYPIIYASGANNIKLTGGGTIRSVDHGSEQINANNPDISYGCTRKIHLVPIGFFGCNNIEIRDIDLRRTNNYHINLRDCENIYVANVTMLEASCVNSDGISVTVGSKNVTIERCYLYGNDDAVTICSTYNDPRGLVWWHANPKDDNCAANIDIRYCNLFGGQGITFIAWGTDNPNHEMQEIKNVNVTQCVLAGGSSVGGWFDNPFYGAVYGTKAEPFDYSPIRDVRIYDNIYKNKISFGETKVTNIITDCGLKSPSNFLNGDFGPTKVHGNSHLTGTSNWSRDIGENGAVSSESEKSGNKTNYYGSVSGNASMYQGLYLNSGKYTVKISTLLLGGKGYFFVKNATTDEVLFRTKIQESSEFNVNSFKFNLTKADTYYLGVEHVGNADDKVSFDDVSVRRGGQATDEKNEIVEIEVLTPETTETLLETEKATETEKKTESETETPVESESETKADDTDKDGSIVPVIIIAAAVVAVIAVAAVLILKKKK